jgi:hypothetical protein
VDTMQRANFEFFLLAAAGVQSIRGSDTVAHYYLVLNGEACSPCTAMDSILGCVLLPACFHPGNINAAWWIMSVSCQGDAHIPS